MITAGVQYFCPCRKYRFFYNTYTVTPKCNIGLVAGLVSGERMREKWRKREGMGRGVGIKGRGEQIRKKKTGDEQVKGGKRKGNKG